MRHVLPAILLGVVSATAAHAAGPTGAIAGQVAFAGTPPAMPELPPGHDPACPPPGRAAWVVVDGGGVPGTLVRLAVGSLRSGAPAPAAPVVVDQKGCEYAPRVVGVVAGQKVAFRNSDPTMHNVHTFAAGDPDVNQAMPKGAPDLVLDVPVPAGDEPYRARCDVHPWMDAWVVVSDGPHFVVSGAGGQFKLDNVPPGTYTLEAWHPYLGKKTAQVTVRPGRTTEARLPAYRPGDYRAPAQQARTP